MNTSSPTQQAGRREWLGLVGAIPSFGRGTAKRPRAAPMVRLLEVTGFVHRIGGV